MKQTISVYSRRLLVSVFLSLIPVTSWAGDSESVAVAPQYGTTHVYVKHGEMDAFVSSILHTFGGTSTSRVLVNVTPVSSETYSQLILTPSGSFSVFDFQTPVPHPFGGERHGYLVRDMDIAIKQAKEAGADVQVEPFDDPIGRDAVIQWPGGVNMQLYWHTRAPDYKPLDYVPENRVYLSPYRIDDFIKSYQAFSRSKVVSDTQVSDTVIGGQGKNRIRQVELDSGFGKIRAFITDGHLTYPFGHERTGYGVSNLKDTLTKATASGAKVLWQSTAAENRASALVEFPGGYIAEIHQETK